MSATNSGKVLKGRDLITIGIFSALYFVVSFSYTGNHEDLCDVSFSIKPGECVLLCGEKQTLAFASVYAMNPSVFVLDEPTANLDLEAITRLRNQILLLKEQGHTVLVAEHRLYFLTDIIDRAFYFQSGKLAHIFTGREFRSLSEQERTKMGHIVLVVSHDREFMQEACDQVLAL